MAVNNEEDGEPNSIDADLAHRLNCTIIGRLILINPDVLGFALQYFELHPSPFEDLKRNNYESKTKKLKVKATPTEVSDYELIESCFNILQASPEYFKYKWNWSKFYKYLTNEDDKVKWIATKCIGIVLGLSEASCLDCSSNLIDDIQKFMTEIKNKNRNNIELQNSLKETEEIAKTVQSVINIAGVLLPVFNEQLDNKQSNLISVPSMNENLQSLALAVASRKCVCLQGTVGCGKTAIVEYLANITGHGSSDFIKVQLGDQTDSKMLLGTYRCTDIPGEFVWQPGVLTQAVTSGKWLLLEDIDSAALDVASVLSNLMETGTLSVPGFKDSIHVKSGFQLFVTQRLIPSMSGFHRQTSGTTSLLEKHWLYVNMEPLSKDELITVIKTLFPVLTTTATKIVEVFLLFSVGNHENNSSNETEVSILKTERLISTRDLIKWCSRTAKDFDVASEDSKLKLLYDAIDIFCCSVSNQEQRRRLAVEISNKLGVVKTSAESYTDLRKPSITLKQEYFIGGRSILIRKNLHAVQLERDTAKFSFTRPSACLLERITSCVSQNEPVLLVGETGTGKTSSVQYLARSTGHKLIVINMNQQSESADLLGGYKPVDLKFLIFPIREEFEILFRSYFAVEPNKKFLLHINTCFQKSHWKSLVTLMTKSTEAALARLRSSKTKINEVPEDSKEEKKKVLLEKWEKLAVKLEKLSTQVKAQLSLAFAFIEGSLIKALKEGHWVLLDEINLANAETLECLSGLLEGSSGSLSLLERGDEKAVYRHPDFTIFACMNPATDVGKKELPVGLRNRFTEFYVDELTEKSDLQLLVGSYLEPLNLPAMKLEKIVQFYLKVRDEALKNLSDGTAHKPHYSLRTLCRALSVAAVNPCSIVLRSLYEAFCLSFLTQLDSRSYVLVEKLIINAILDKTDVKAILNSQIPKPRSIFNEDYIEFEGYWVVKGSLEPNIPKNYILTQTVKRNLRDVARVVSIGKMPLLLQGDTSVGKTSLIQYLAKASGHVCVRINNHEHTDLQEYVGSYVADKNGILVFKEGILVEAMRKGYWIILDELNLAPSDVLEALNRVLDDNRELFIPETQQTVKAHENFMLFATQNPPGVYAGRKVLSRAFRNRFVELHFDEIPPSELEIILEQRCSLPKKYCQQIIAVMTELQLRRKSTAAFAGKQGFVTLRDLFRWGERYRLAPNVEGFYDYSQHLADEGYLVLAAKVRRPEEAKEIREVMKKHLNCDVDPDKLFTLSDKTSPVTKSILEAIENKNDSPFKNIVWTYHMRRMAVLVEKSYRFKEPVLLVGETGGGKTTICQLIAHMNNRNLHVVNCHMHTESSDFLGNLRPVRHHNDEEEQKLFEWVDGPLIKAMQNGDFFLADEISLADDSVLERLNSLLEPERSLLLAEKGIDVQEEIDDVKNIIVANENFSFIGTMNPGGDYGKKELSPALRNRFTEIWCDGCTERKDLQAIIEHNLITKAIDYREKLAICILDFIEWFSTSDVGKRLTVSIRDILSWVKFINVCLEETELSKLNLLDAYYHGACLTYIDSLGSGLTSMESTEKLNLFKKNAIIFLENQMKDKLKNFVEESMDIDSDEPTTSTDMFGMAPFFISKGPNTVDEKSNSFTFHAPTTKQNSLKLMRALQLRKPILLEGSPGVGKTSLVTALAKASGYNCLRINLSDQTDISDLFGADLPVEGGKGGEFSWRDGPFLRALRAGDWILLDELNLASQSVLEGLNACFDHRSEIYIPELGKTFDVKPETKLFACQNPLRQGGARRGLPKSFLNRFTQVFVDALTDVDLEFIISSQFPEINKSIISKMVQFNSRLSKEAGISWGFSGAPWEMNLRDITRWCEATISAAEKSYNGQTNYNPGTSVELIYVDRMRTEEDKIKVREIYGELFNDENKDKKKIYPVSSSPIMHLTDDYIHFGDVALKRTDSSIYSDQNLLLLRYQMSTLRSLAQCVQMNWMSILVGASGCGKSSVVRVLAQINGQQLKSLVVNSAMDTTEILGGFEQTDYNRHLEQLAKKTENLLTQCLKAKICKENICQIEKYQALIEKVREISHDEYESVTMAKATEIFLNKIKILFELLFEIKNFEVSIAVEIEKIESDLEKLQELVEEDNCLNAGGKFEWVDSILVKCLQEGTWLIIDQVNLCSPAVLDRLNGLLEPNGVLSIGERGVNKDGEIVSIKPHKNFRLFLTMDPKYGEISRAMRNRGVEIFMLNYNENPETGKFDYRSLLYNSGLIRRDHQEALMSIHMRLIEDSSNVDKLNVIQLLHAAFLIVQQLVRGLEVKQAFKSSCINVYLKARFIHHRETKMRLISIIEEEIEEFQIREIEDNEDNDINDEYIVDLDAATCSIKNLQYNSKLTMIRQQGLLLDWCIKSYLYTEKQFTDNEDKVSVKMAFINDFFDLDDNFSSKEVLDILPYILLNFYEHSTFGDVSIRKAWISNILNQNTNLQFLNKKNLTLADSIMNFDLEGFDCKMPWDTENFEKANNLALLLFYEALVVNTEMKNDWTVDNSSNTITIAQFSEAYRNGKMTINLDNQPLITNYVIFLQRAEICIHKILKKCENIIIPSEYVTLRNSLKWFSRFCNLGKMILINKETENEFQNLDEVILLLKVHYKWLKKFINSLLENYDYVHELSDDYEKDCEALNIIMNEIDSSLTSVHDPFTKMCKFYKKHTIIPLPCSSNKILEIFSQLQNITESFTPFRNKYISKNLIEEPKLLTFQKEKSIKIRSMLISLWEKVYTNEILDDDIFSILDNLHKFCTMHMNVTESENIDESNYMHEVESFSSNDIEKMTSDIQMWPIHEYMFILFVEHLQSKLGEQLTQKENGMDRLSLIYSSHIFMKIPNIPIELVAILNAIFSQKLESKEKNRLIFALFSWFSKFNENSYAIKNFKQVFHWKHKNSTENNENSNNIETFESENLMSGPVLINLFSELLLNKSSQSSLDISNFSSMATLGNYRLRIEQIKTLKDILWKNSIFINSKQFNHAFNDAQTLHCLLQSFLTVCDKVEADSKVKKVLKNEKNNSTFMNEYVRPLKDLRNMVDNLESKPDCYNRGKTWALLGYLQSFVFGNMGYIDPVHKVAIKLRYVEEDIIDCENTIYIAKLYSRIFGLTNDNILHPRLSEINDGYEKLSSEKNSLLTLKAVRPANTEFISLSKEFTNFRVALGSYEIVNKHVQRLIDTASELKKAVKNNLLIETAKSIKREAEIWLESVRRFMEQIESRFLAGYPDIVYPILGGLAQMRHGVRILVEENCKLIASSEVDSDQMKVESFVCNLVRFPSITSGQESLLNLVNLCTSHSSRELISINIKSKDSITTFKEQFRLTITGLYEFYNYIVLRGYLTKELWNHLNGLLQQIVLIWRQQQLELERRQVEKDSLYKNQTTVKGDSLTEEEELAQELENLFPSYHDDDFSDITDVANFENTEKFKHKENDSVELITDFDIKVVQNIHSSIVKLFTSSEWLCKNIVKTKPDFVEPLLQRYNTFSFILNNAAPALSNELTEKLYTSMNVLAQLVIQISQGVKLDSDNCISNAKKNAKVYDYYKDSNVEEVVQCKPILENLLVKVLDLLKEFPENPTLVSIKTILQRIFSFPATSALSRFLTGLELLLINLDAWQCKAHRGVSIEDHITAVKQQIISWRKLELACWKDSLETAHMRLKSQTSKWWFLLYDLFYSYIQKNQNLEEKIIKEEIMTSDKLIESLEKFMIESSLVEFEARLELLLTFHCHFYYIDQSDTRDELLAISWNIYKSYIQFLPAVNERIDVIKKPIEKDLKNYVKIVRFNDYNSYAMKETVTKLRKDLHKFIKKYETSLKELVTQCLTVKPSYKSKNDGIWDRPQSTRNAAIDPNDFIVSTANLSTVENISINSDLISRADSHYLTKAKKLCRETILASLYPGIRVSLEEFIEEYTTWSENLRSMEIDRTLPLPKQKSKAKSIQHQKRAALAGYFKTLMLYGVSYRIGTFAWKNKLDEVLDYTIPPVDLKVSIKPSSNNDPEKKILDQWDGCENYYYGSMIKLNALDEAFYSGKTDLGGENIEKCRGFSVHLLLMANAQKKTLSGVVKYFVKLQSQISELSKINNQNYVIAKQKELHICVKDLKELLIVLQTVFEQFLIYLQACPIDPQVESEDNSYTLLDEDSLIINCKKDDAIWGKANSYVRESLSTVSNIFEKLDYIYEKHCIETNEPNLLLTKNHLALLIESFNSLKNIKEKMHEFSRILVTSEEKNHPLLENVVFLISNIDNKLIQFELVSQSLKNPSESELLVNQEHLEGFENNLNKLINVILKVIENKYKGSFASDLKKDHDDNTDKNEVKEEEDEDETAFEKNKIKEKLVESLETELKSLKLEEIFQRLSCLLKTAFDADCENTSIYCKLFQKCLPILQQYMLLIQFYINEQVASFRITCKILHMQLNVFLDLATNGFCKPQDLDLEDGEGTEEKSGGEGMGLGEGEGKTDVSEKIESEDQLEDAKPAGQESDKPEDKECPEEDKGIEMSEDFEGQLQDVDKKDDEADDNDGDEDENVDKQMGETGDGADTLDEQIWGDDEEPESEETQKNDDDIGKGEETGEKEFGAKDDKPKDDAKDKNNDDHDDIQKEPKEINEMEEPQYDEDQINALHGNLPPEPEPEPLELPEDLNIDDETRDGEEKQDEQNPFDIDEMKETMLPQEPEEADPTENEENKDDNEMKNDDSSDEENEPEKEKLGDQNENTPADDNVEDTDVKTLDPNNENQVEEPKPDEEKKSEDDQEKAEPSMDKESKETDASEQVDQSEGGSRDQVSNKADAEQKTSEELNPTENWQDEKKDKGMGQSQAEQHDTGHSGSSTEKSSTIPNRDDDSQKTEKRKNPGESDETHTLAEKIEPDRKKLKTMIHSKENLPDDDNNEEGIDVDDKGEPDMCQHVKEKEQFDNYAMDAATEAQSKEQASNLEKETETLNEEEKEESMDIDMHEDQEPEILEDESTLKQKPEKLSEEESRDKKDSKEKGKVEDGQLETVVDIEGEITQTEKVERAAESAFFTNLTEIENDLISTQQNQMRRMEVEQMLSQWSNVPTTEEATVAWNTLSAVTDAAARDLSEKLRLVLEPTQASRLKGDYRTGRRINMRKIIPYIASQFRKDKIWLRRTKPSKRDYQIVLAIDDSSSMADNHSKELAFESLSLISKAMNYLEAGQLSVLSFGEQTNILHPLGETFSEHSGSRLMQEIKFEQKKTMVGQLTEFVTDMFQCQSNSTENAKLLVIVSDGRNIFSEGMEKVKRAIRKARLADIFLVFIIVDNPLNKDSILDMKTVEFENGKPIRSPYMDKFPFPFYIILRDINSLPGVLSDSLRQWFEVVGKIDT